MRARADAVARELADGGLKPENGKRLLLETREAVLDGWRGLADILERDGNPQLASTVRRLAQSMPPPLTGKERMARQIRLLLEARKARDRVLTRRAPPSGLNLNINWHIMPMEAPAGGLVIMPTRNVVLTDRQAELVERLVAEGRYQNASEVMREGLRLIEDKEERARAQLKALREAARVGIADIENGRYRTFENAAEVTRHLEALRDKALAKKPVR